VVTIMELRNDVVKEEAFTLSSLPLTMELANMVKAQLLPKLKRTCANWPYEDRIPVWLEPSFSDEIKQGRMRLVGLREACR
jgi:hypothetical protein